MWKSLLLWTTSLFDPLISCASGPAFHTILRLYTRRFRPPVGRVGNLGRSRSLATPFSKSPDWHIPNLENSPSVQPPVLQPHRHNSHFSSSPTGTTAFVFLLFTQTHPTRRIADSIQPCASQLLSAPSWLMDSVSSREFREPYLFSTPTKTRGCIQSGVEKTVTSARPFQCCRVRPARMRGFGSEAGPCQSSRRNRKNRLRRGQEWRSS